MIIIRVSEQEKKQTNCYHCALQIIDCSFIVLFNVMAKTPKSKERGALKKEAFINSPQGLMDRAQPVVTKLVSGLLYTMCYK